MGVVGSKIRFYGKRFVMRYNAEERAQKFLEKEKLAPAPRHEVKAPEIPLSREALEDIHCKNPQLDDYLKKVYLTSTSKVTGTPSTRPKPKKENEKFKKRMFYEPEVPALGCCTLTNVLEILLNFDPESKDWNLDSVAKKYKLDKKDVVFLISYYSLYRHEKFEFMNVKETEEEMKAKFEDGVLVETKPLKRLQSK